MKVKFYALLGILSFASVSLTYAQANLRGAATQASTQDFKGFQKIRSNMTFVFPLASVIRMQ